MSVATGSYPSYLALHESGELARRAAEAVRALACCEICPRNCRVDRLADRAKVCSTGRLARVSTFFPHFGEEDCLRGWNGSGTIFFSFCNLKCVFCQNHDASQAGDGDEVSAEGLATMMLALQGSGCHNINLVTPEHVVPEILEALPIAIGGGLKVWTKESAIRYLKAKDYRAVACRVVREMHRQVGPLEISRASQISAMPPVARRVSGSKRGAREPSAGGPSKASVRMLPAALRGERACTPATRLLPVVRLLQLMTENLRTKRARTAGDLGSRR